MKMDDLFFTIEVGGERKAIYPFDNVNNKAEFDKIAKDKGKEAIFKVAEKYVEKLEKLFKGDDVGIILADILGDDIEAQLSYRVAVNHREIGIDIHISNFSDVASLKNVAHILTKEYGISISKATSTMLQIFIPFEGFNKPS